MPIVAGGLALDLDDPDADWTPVPVAELILLAEWDSRNGVVSCEAHHRRFDSALMPPLTVPLGYLPDHVIAFAYDWGIEGQLDRFPM
jgi:hypothetical protein